MKEEFSKSRPATGLNATATQQLRPGCDLARYYCLSIRNARTPNYAPAQAKLIVLFKLEICLYASKSAWDTTETQPVGQRSLKNQIYPLVTEPLQKYISSLQKTKEFKIVFVF